MSLGLLDITAWVESCQRRLPRGAAWSEPRETVASVAPPPPLLLLCHYRVSDQEGTCSVWLCRCVGECQGCANRSFGQSFWVRVFFFFFFHCNRLSHAHSEREGIFSGEAVTRHVCVCLVCMRVCVCGGGPSWHAMRGARDLCDLMGAKRTRLSSVNVKIAAWWMIATVGKWSLVLLSYAHPRLNIIAQVWTIGKDITHLTSLEIPIYIYFFIKENALNFTTPKSNNDIVDD